MRMALCKVATCDNTTVFQDQRYQTTKITQLHNWISADLQARIKPRSIPLIKVEREEEKIQHNKGQDAEKPGLSHTRYVRVKNGHI